MQHRLVQVAVYLITLVCLGVETLQTCLCMISCTQLPQRFEGLDLQHFVLFKLRQYLLRGGIAAMLALVPKGNQVC